jgi:hypothetical protein
MWNSAVIGVAAFVLVLVGLIYVLKAGTELRVGIVSHQ